MIPFDAADSFIIEVHGQGAQALFAQAAQRGIRLGGIRRTAGGYAARVAGRDLPRLRALAERGGWRLHTVRRRGPGRRLEHLARRPGLICGAMLFFVLMRLFSAFVWSIDLGDIDAAQAQTLRALLAENGIWEGCYLPQAQLQKAQQAMSLAEGRFAWLSLNLTGGCLFVEYTPQQQQPIATEPEQTALYAAADGLVLAVEVDSGFAAVEAGQYVEEGGLLAAAARLDHGGEPVYQAAAGRVLARVEKTYTADQPCRVKGEVLNGRSAVRRALLTPLGTFALQDEALPKDALFCEERRPLRMGRIALPGCLHIVTAWQRHPQTLVYTPDTAAALARRSCRAQLAADFPDAEIEEQAAEIKTEQETARCTVRYIFRADIARAKPAQGEPLP